MTRAAIALIAIVFAAVPALAQAPGGTIGVFTDVDGTGDCSLTEQVGSINTIYVVHKTGPDAQGARFKISHNWSAVFIQAIYPIIYLEEPDIFGGDHFSYGGCKSTPYVIATLEFMPLAPTTPCTVTFHVEPDPAALSGSIEVVDCTDNTVLADEADSWIVVNRNENCECSDAALHIDEKSWSRIKALYK
jgi:hypothetical protein